MLGIDPPPNIADPYPRDAERLTQLLGDIKVNWDRYSYICVNSVADVLTKLLEEDWIENPPYPRFAKECDVTAKNMHEYEKHCEFVAAGGDYEDVNEAFWSDAWI